MKMSTATTNLPGLPISLQPALRLLGYPLTSRGWGTVPRRNPDETKMSSTEMSTGVTIDANKSQSAATPARKRQRPLTAGQEALFFGVTFAIAVALQVVVVLKVADVISW